MKGNQILDQLRQNANKTAPTPQVTVSPDPPEPDDGSYEAPDRSGIENGKYAQQGFVLTDTGGTPLGIMYSAIQNTIRWLEPAGLEFVFEDDRGLWTVTIIGADGEAAKKHLEKLQMRLIGQKRETLWPNPTVIKQILIEKIEEEPEAP